MTRARREVLTGTVLTLVGGPPLYALTPLTDSTTGLECICWVLSAVLTTTGICILVRPAIEAWFNRLPD